MKNAMTKKAKPLRAWMIVNPRNQLLGWSRQETKRDVLKLFHDAIGPTGLLKKGWRIARIEEREVER